MKKVSISLVISLLAVFGALAQTKPQDYLFKVLISSGDNSIIKNGKWESVKIGTQLGKNDQVRVEGFLGLQHNSGKTVEIKTAGTYKVADLVSKVPTGSSSVAEKYASFVAKRMAGGGNSGTNQNATGASERPVNPPLYAMLPFRNNISVLKEKVTFKWFADPSKKTKTYNVLVKDFCGKELLNVVTKDTFYVIDFNEAKFNITDETCQTMSLFVHSKENKSYQDKDDTPYSLEVLNANANKEVQKELAGLLPANGELTAMEAVSIGAFFEEKKLFTNALEYYEKAMKLEPNVPDFKTIYHRFIKENKIGKLEPVDEKKKNK